MAAFNDLELFSSFQLVFFTASYVRLSCALVTWCWGPVLCRSLRFVPELRRLPCSTSSFMFHFMFLVYSHKLKYSMQNVDRITTNMQDRKVMQQQDSYNCPKNCPWGCASCCANDFIVEYHARIDCNCISRSLDSHGTPVMSSIHRQRDSTVELSRVGIARCVLNKQQLCRAVCTHSSAVVTQFL